MRRVLAPSAMTAVTRRAAAPVTSRTGWYRASPPAVDVAGRAQAVERAGRLLRAHEARRAQGRALHGRLVRVRLRTHPRRLRLDRLADHLGQAPIDHEGLAEGS